MTFEVCAREWLERQNFIKSTRKWAHQGLEIYAYPVIGDKELKEIRSLYDYAIEKGYVSENIAYQLKSANNISPGSASRR